MPNKFKRRICKGGDAKTKLVLDYLRDDTGWWKDILDARYGDDERRLFLAVRDGSMNAYADGQSVLQIEFPAVGSAVTPQCKIHYKYIDAPPRKPPYYIFDGKQVNGVTYEDTTLKSWVDRALGHRSTSLEKRGVAVIAARHANVIDLEMGLPANDPPEGQKKANAQMDIVALEKTDGTIRLVFYEVKQFINPELRSSTGNPKVLKQLKKYEDYVTAVDRRKQVIEAYQDTCSILCDFAAMRGTEVGDLIREVGKGAKLDLDPKPRLVIFGYDVAQANRPEWPQHKKVLEAGGLVVLMSPQAEGVVLGLPART